MSHDAFLSVKVECPHGSIEGARKHSGDNGSSGSTGGMSSLYLSLAVADGKHECKGDREQRCVREGKPTRLKRGKTE
jgi:hypothetical protein